MEATIQGISFPLSLQPTGSTTDDLYPWKATPDGRKVYRNWPFPGELLKIMARCMLTPLPEGGWELVITDHTNEELTGTKGYDMEPETADTLWQVMMIAGERVAALRDSMQRREIERLKRELEKATDSREAAERSIRRAEQLIDVTRTLREWEIQEALDTRFNEFSLVVVTGGSAVHARAERRLFTGTLHEIDAYVDKSGGMEGLTAQLGDDERLHRLPADKWREVRHLNHQT